MRHALRSATRRALAAVAAAAGIAAIAAGGVHLARHRHVAPGPPADVAPTLPPGQPRPASFAVDCRSPARPISPLVYGIGTYFQDDSPHQWALGATARRWGGNASSRYNWEHGNAWSTNHDWFFRNVPVRESPGFSYRTFLDENRSHGVLSALTLPTLGWVARDTSSYSFPVSELGPQQATAWDLPDAGNGRDSRGRPIRPVPVERTSVHSTPDSVERWVRRIRESDRLTGRSVHLYILDNEPTLWHDTHRDVHPERVGYDELYERTVAYASAVRRADPEATIAGPAEWGWDGYHMSARDLGWGPLRLDRWRHGNVPLIPWYLRKLREHRERTGVRLLDVLDVHFYPAAPGVGGAGKTDPATAALRIRSTRSLWDPGYVDESWIAERMRVLPLMRQWIAENDPGLGLSIGEWNFGAERHMSGGLATAEALGRFGAEGVTWAFYWSYPPERSPAYWAFRAYRDFDGTGGRFLDLSLPVTGDAGNASLFASRDERGRHVVLVLLNHDPERPLAATVELRGCDDLAALRTFSYGGGEEGFAPDESRRWRSGLEHVARPYTITVLDLTLAPGGAAER